MTKISGQVESTKHIKLNRAAEIMSRFAAVENGASPAVSIYLQRAAEAFNKLVQFHDKTRKSKKSENSPNLVEKNLDEEDEKDSEIKVRKKDRKNLDETNFKENEAEISIKKKRKKSDESDTKEKEKSRKKKKKKEQVLI